MSTAAPAGGSFSERVSRLLERVDYRRADTPEEREATFRLRYDAYLREGAITPNPARRFTDAYDDKPNTWTFGVYIDGTLASSMRLNVTVPECRDLPALQVFADILNPQIAAGQVIVDPTRFVTERTCSRLYPELPYVTLRLVWTALEYFQANTMLATVRGEHQAFYKRLWGATPLCPPRPYPTLTKPIACMALNYGEARDRVQARYPFFQSTFFERRMLFERYRDTARHWAAA
jgi:N-acyl-L-homoserine lactone synthetase